MYEYACAVDRLVDGDTVDLIVDLGFNIRIHERFRLKGIDTPEVRGKDRELGKEATEHLRYLIEDGLKDGDRLVVRTEKMKKGKYGRWIGTLVLLPGSTPKNVHGLTGINLNEQMVKDGYAIEKEY